jgi:hypothetical protein
MTANTTRAATRKKWRLNKTWVLHPGKIAVVSYRLAIHFVE